MTDQSCPLCGEEMKVERTQITTDLFETYYMCLNKICTIYGVMLNQKMLDRFKEKIARIRQEAKQEFANDLDGIVCDGCAGCEEGDGYCEGYLRLKKKHGVE